MSFSIQERCCCGAAISVESTDTSDGGQIFAADFINAWRSSHRHQATTVTPPEGETHIGVDSLVESGIGFRRGLGVEADG